MKAELWKSIDELFAVTWLPSSSNMGHAPWDVTRGNSTNRARKPLI